MTKRTLSLVLAGIVALSLLVTGAYAWVDNAQHKSNIAQGGKSGKNDVVLVEDYEEPDDWEEGGQLKKEIWVRNTGDGPVYVRLQLKEYMDIAKQSYEYSTDELLLDSDGRFISANTAASLKAWLQENLPTLVFEDSQIKPFTAYGDTQKYYLATNASTNLNGKYGKRLMTNFAQAEPRSLVEGVERGIYEPTIDHKLHPTSECLYTPHGWDDPAENCGHGDNGDTPALGFHDYVEWLLGEDVILLSDWDGKAVAAWILDDTGDAGWAYWGQVLEAGAYTAKLLEKITLIKQPDGPFYYALHVDMQAADLAQLSSNFNGMPAAIEAEYRATAPAKSGLSISADKTGFTKTNGDDGVVTFTAAWNGTAVPAADITWAVEPMDGQAKGPFTRFAAVDGTATPGVLTIGGGQPDGRLKVSATYTPAGGAATTKNVTITVN